VAIHESGHAILAAVFRKYFDLKKVSIQSTYSGAGGYTVFNEHRNITDSGLYTKDLLFKRLVIGMGGKAAENVYYGDADVSVGAVQDLKQTNSLAQRMIGNYGMGTKLEAFYNEDLDSARISSKYSDHTKEQLDDEVLSLVNNAYIEAKKILRSNKGVVDLLVEKLLDQNILTGPEVRELLYHISDDTEYDE
jgi:cell division protease FtsH